MSQLVSEAWLQLCQLSSHAFSAITFLMHRVYLIQRNVFIVTFINSLGLPCIRTLA